MNRKSDDRPNLVVFPPLVVVVTVALGCALQWLHPLGILAGIGGTWRIVPGALLMVAGVAVAASGRLSLMRAGTNVNPLRPATVLVTAGIYRWTRNPMYSGIFTAMIGLALAFALDWLPLLLVPAALILHFGIVRREERYLVQKFGDAYGDYRRSVPRYFGFATSTIRKTDGSVR